MRASVGKGRTWVCDVAAAEVRARWENGKQEDGDVILTLHKHDFFIVADALH
jgi:hypothetical protein